MRDLVIVATSQNTLVDDCMEHGYQGIGEKTATYILECREKSAKPFKRVN